MPSHTHKIRAARKSSRALRASLRDQPLSVLRCSQLKHVGGRSGGELTERKHHSFVLLGPLVTLAASLGFSRVRAGFPGRLRPHGPSCRQLTNSDGLSPHATAEKRRECDKLMTVSRARRAASARRALRSRQEQQLAHDVRVIERPPPSACGSCRAKPCRTTQRAGRWLPQSAFKSLRMVLLQHDRWWQRSRHRR